MFGLNMTGCAVWRINSYAEAVAFFDKCPTRRGTDARKIKGKEGSRYMNVRMRGDNVVFRYHSTDAVVWRPDNTYLVDLTYDSRSTCTFVNRFIPNGHYAAKEGHHLIVGDTVYPARCRLTVTAGGVVSGMLSRFGRTVVDRKRARQILLETNYHAYKAWYEVMFPMVAGSLPPSWQREPLSGERVLAHLQSPDLWHALMVSLDGSPEKVRTILYSLFGGYTEVTADTLPNDRTADKWRLV